MAEAVIVNRPLVCLCVICGLPGAGKSTLAGKILESATDYEWRATVVSYDDLIPEDAFYAEVSKEDVKQQNVHTEWKSHRQAVLQCIEGFLEKPEMFAESLSCSLINKAAWERCIHALLPQEGGKGSKAPILFILDDNFYYSSMRYEVFQLSRKCSLGFCQIYVECDLETCINRNQSRSNPVSTDVILDMVKRLESPNRQKNTWEMQSLFLKTTDFSIYDIQSVMKFISSALHNPLCPVEDNTEQKEADRLKCANSVVHRADQLCRRLISHAMVTARENQLSSEHMKTLAALLNECKAKFLHNLRRQFLQETLLIQGEDINMEHVVKRAVEVFDGKKMEILMDFLEKHKSNFKN